MGKGLRVAAIAASFTLLAGAAGITGYGWHKQAAIDRARGARIQTIVDRFKACPERFRAVNSCLSPADRLRMIGEAERMMREGDLLNAGVAFAELMEENQARLMASRCGAQGNLEARDSILNTLRERQEAVRRTRRELGQ